ncbi:MAG: isopentenyl-diphosphate Delta-isomerase [Flavobacteriia bacterium]|jgi:isopentenyl-diphosphate delta-isomerase|nr:isopentenyl-diphosphate Delta-isomerase [Flavobacteriia bacterium]
MPDEYVVLVNEQDQVLGQLEKIEAHELGLLHRAFSVLLFNDRGELLLQQRAAHKYHSPLLWTNTCCSHQRPNETTLMAAERRLKEEMGMSAPMQTAFKFQYKATLDQGLTEHELDHVLFGYTNQDPNINPEEVAAFRWISMDQLLQELQSKRDSFTIWFQILLDQHLEKITKAANESM